MRKARLVLLLVTWGCGSTGASADTADGSPLPGTSAEASVHVGAIFQDLLPQVTQRADGGAFESWALCPDASLAVGDAGLPNCVVVSARLPSANDFDACRRCDAPGLEPFVAPVPLDSIGEGLSNYTCLCAVKPLCSFVDPTIASWCYTEDPELLCRPKSGPSLTFSQGALESGALYIACFDPPGAP